jgi:hypothetical protein
MLAQDRGSVPAYEHALLHCRELPRSTHLLLMDPLQQSVAA